MKLSLLGVGNAGTRLVDQLLAAERESKRAFIDGQVLAFNTTESTFAETDHIDEDRQVVVGDTHPEVDSYEVPASEVDEDGEGEESDREDAGNEDRREGVGGDPELGVEVARDDLPEIRRALDKVDDTEVDAALVVTGFGGGTGCGVGSVLLEELQAIYEIPVYVLGVLPSDDESDRRAWTAARAVRTLVPMADATFPVDNEAWTSETAGEMDGYEEINEQIATRFLSLFGAGEAETETLSELRMDPNDIGRTLDVGGVATVGYARTELDPITEGWLTKLRRLLGFETPEPEPQTDAMAVKRLVQRGLESKLTLPCDVSTTDRVLLILSGPSRELSRKGFETGRKLLEDETGTVEILAGDEPLNDADAITATVLLSNVTGVPRIEALQERAVAFQRERDGYDSADSDDSTDGDDSDADGPTDDQPIQDAPVEDESAGAESGDEASTDEHPADAEPPSDDESVDTEQSGDHQSVDAEPPTDEQSAEDGRSAEEEQSADDQLSAEEHGFQFDDTDPDQESSDEPTEPHDEEEPEDGSATADDEASDTEESDTEYTVKDPFK